MGFLDFFRKETVEQTVATSMPLITDLSSVQYPEDNYSNFSKEGYGKSATVHACIRELAAGVSSPRYFTRVTQDGESVETSGSPLSELVQYPNEGQDFHSFLENLVTHLYVSGNAYVLKERARNNQIVAVYLLRPDRVAIGADGYVYTVDGKDYEIAEENIGHLTMPNPGGDRYGLSPLHVISKIVNLDMSMTDFAKVYFQNAGVPSGLLKIKRRLNNQEEAERIRSRWRSTFGGTYNFHSVAVLDEDADYQQMASAPNDMALTELHNMTESRICSVLGVPPILISANVGLQRSTYANYREARYSFHSETLEPLVNKIVRFLNYCLSKNFDGNEEIAVDTNQMRLFLEDKETVNARATTLFEAGIITLNEARKMVGQDTIEEGNVRRIESNVEEIAEGDDRLMAPNSAPPLPAPEPSNEEEEEELALSMAKERIAPRGQATHDALQVRREALEDRWSDDFEKYFRKLQSRVDGVLGRYLSRDIDIDKQKGYPFIADDFIPASDLGILSDLLYRMAFDTSRGTFSVINVSGIAGTVEFSDDLPVVSAVLTNATSRATLIHGTTKKGIQKIIERGLENGYSIEQLARGVPNDGFPGMKSLMNENLNRARLVARTEIVRTQNLTVLGVYNEQGFSFVRAVDHGSDGPCLERNGQVFSVDEASTIEDHPNGTLSWVPMPRSYQAVPV